MLVSFDTLFDQHDQRKHDQCNHISARAPRELLHKLVFHSNRFFCKEELQIEEPPDLHFKVSFLSDKLLLKYIPPVML